MNLNEIINKIEPEVCEVCSGTGYEYFEDKNADNYKDCLVACDRCKGTGYKHTVDELVMSVIGDLWTTYSSRKIKSDNAFIFGLTNAFIKIVQICRMRNVEVKIKNHLRYIFEDWGMEWSIIKLIEMLVRCDFREICTAFLEFCNYHNIDILKHVEERLK